MAGGPGARDEVRLAQLEADLSSAFARDAAFRATDEMKKRAIVSARSYDEFRHLVAAAGQRPIDAADIARKPTTAPNRGLGGGPGAAGAAGGPLGFGLELLPGGGGGVGGSGGGGGGGGGADDDGARAAALAAAAAARVAAGAAGGGGAPAGGAAGAAGRGGGALLAAPAAVASPADFERAWRRLPRDAPSRSRFLVGLGAPALERLFAADVDGGVLGEAAEAAAGGAAARAAPAAALGAALLALTRGPGFDFARELLGAKEAAAVGALARACDDEGAGETAKELREKFRVA